MPYEERVPLSSCLAFLGMIWNIFISTVITKHIEAMYNVVRTDTRRVGKDGLSTDLELFCPEPHRTVSFQALAITQILHLLHPSRVCQFFGFKGTARRHN
jgi:hypothetical protein